MPNIRQLDSPVDSLKTTDMGATAFKQAGARIGAFYDEVGRAFGSAISTTGGEVAKYVEHREVSAGAKDAASIFDNLTQQWNETAKTADPNDPTVAAKFREEQLEPALEKFRDGFMTEGGQKYAERQVESLRSHLFHKTASDMATLAGQSVVANLDAMTNRLTNSVHADPSGLSAAFEVIDSSIPQMVKSNPNITAAMAGKIQTEVAQNLKEKVAKSAFVGAVRNNPEAGLALSKDPRYSQYLSGQDAEKLEQEARAVQRAERVDRTYQKHLANEAANDRSTAAENEALKRIYPPEGKQPNITTRDIVNNDDLKPATKKNLINIIERETKPETDAKVSARTSVDLMRLIRDPDADPKKLDDMIFEARTKDPGTPGSLTKADFQEMQRQLLDRRTPEGMRAAQSKEQFLKAVAPMIDKSNPLMGKIDQDGKLNEYRLRIDLDRKFDEYKKAGKNPYDLLDPSKPDFMGRPDALQQFQKPLAQSMRDTAQRLRGNVNLTGPDKDVTAIGTPRDLPAALPPRKPGESPAEYLKRTGH